ncbi:hypothetical protein D3C74_303640 [compost metagenome]
MMEQPIDFEALKEEMREKAKEHMLDTLHSQLAQAVALNRPLIADVIRNKINEIEEGWY